MKLAIYFFNKNLCKLLVQKNPQGCFLALIGAPKQKKKIKQLFHWICSGGNDRINININELSEVDFNNFVVVISLLQKIP